MKAVIAYIKSHKLPEVTMALHQVRDLTRRLGIRCTWLCQAVHTGLLGDGKIYVCVGNQAVRISSGLSWRFSF